MTRVVSCFLAYNRTETGVALWTVGVVRSNELEVEEMMIADVCLAKSVGGRPPGWVAPVQNSLAEQQLAWLTVCAWPTLNTPLSNYRAATAMSEVHEHVQDVLPETKMRSAPV